MNDVTFSRTRDGKVVVDFYRNGSWVESRQLTPTTQQKINEFLGVSAPRFIMS